MCFRGAVSCAFVEACWTTARRMVVEGRAHQVQLCLYRTLGRPTRRSVGARALLCGWSRVIACQFSARRRLVTAPAPAVSLRRSDLSISMTIGERSGNPCDSLAAAPASREASRHLRNSPNGATYKGCCDVHPIGWRHSMRRRSRRG